MAKTSPVPECLSFIICEGVVEDARSHNKSIFNCFNEIRARAFPVIHDRLTVFLALTNGHGTVNLRIRLSKDDKEPYVTLRGELSFPSPLHVVDMVFNMRQVPLPEPGAYRIEAWVDDRMVSQRRLMVLNAAEGEEHGNQGHRAT